ncbi:Uncharacterised protein [Mycobacteroides abscessus subsp. abscessus]|nr:Uncharacterised protein [Mycobacteroides abscessus subsp. abscessus]
MQKITPLPFKLSQLLFQIIDFFLKGFFLFFIIAIIHLFSFFLNLFPNT